MCSATVENTINRFRYLLYYNLTRILLYSFKYYHGIRALLSDKLVFRILTLIWMYYILDDMLL